MYENTVKLLVELGIRNPVIIMPVNTYDMMAADKYIAILIERLRLYEVMRDSLSKQYLDSCKMFKTKPIGLKEFKALKSEIKKLWRERPISLRRTKVGKGKIQK